MRRQLLSLIQNPKFVGRSRWYHLNYVAQLFHLHPLHINVVFERRVSDIKRIFKITQLFDASRNSGGWIIVFAVIDGFEQFCRETFLAESSVPFSLGGLQF